MDEIRKAILNGECDEVWALSKAQDFGEEGLSSLLDLALRKGVLASVIPLIAKGAVVTWWELSGDTLVDYFSEVSSGWCASWLVGIEYEAYNRALGNATSDTWAWEFAERQIDDIRILSAKLGGWAAWVDGGPKFVPMDEWKSLHRAWLRGRSTS